MGTKNSRLFLCYPRRIGFVQMKNLLFVLVKCLHWQVDRFPKDQVHKTRWCAAFLTKLMWSWRPSKSRAANHQAKPEKWIWQSS